jgi:hypothetical protein
MDVEVFDGFRAARLERQPSVAAIHPIIDLKRLKSQIARAILRNERQMFFDVVRHLRFGRPQFAPGDLAVLIGVDAHRQFDVPDRDFHGSGDVISRHVRDHKAIARHMCLRRTRKRERDQKYRR